MHPDHDFAVSVEWTGNRGEGTATYRSYGREHRITAAGKPDLAGSAARVFHGNADRWNPEEELIAALSSCHMMSYLHVAVRNGIVVEAYTDAATGRMRVDDDGGGRFTAVMLRPVVTISSGDPDLARSIHAEASRLCFIASSVNFPVHHEPEIRVASPE
jgi:organic hydroperoxide reductase OsmC/OhrA